MARTGRAYIPRVDEPPGASPDVRTGGGAVLSFHVIHFTLSALNAAADLAGSKRPGLVPVS
jgi:hypothetical protein